MFRNFIKDERGMAVLFLYFMIIFLVLGVVTFDFSRAHAVRARLRTAVDAAALAGVMTARAQCEYDYVPIDEDGDGVPDRIEQKLKAVHMSVYDKNRADKDAGETYGKNMPKSNKWGVRTEPGSIKSDVIPDTYYKEKKGVHCYGDSYAYEAVARVKAFLMSGALAGWLVGVDEKEREIPVKAKGTAQVVPTL
ncbi:MAG: hypothetical protein C4542_02100 [Dehalococcoidia bacterium]|nr:MAG: hypothetical protein C4542_02100 [Dehalococcoidia bacterium]